jgi:ribose-phosphate pyrophosphokinase
MIADDVLIFGGSGSPKLTLKICEYLHVHPGAGEVLRFSEGNLFVRVKENVRGRRVYVVQSTVFPANDNFMELLFWIDALKRASAESVTVVMPYFSYAKGDKKDEPRVSIRARVCADAIEVAGANRVVTLDLHAPRFRASSIFPLTPCTPYRSCATRSSANSCWTLSWCPRTRVSRNKRASMRRFWAPLSPSRINNGRHTTSRRRYWRSSGRYRARPP